MKFFIISILIFMPLVATAYQTNNADAVKIEKYLGQYSPYEMNFDASAYGKNDKLILKKLVQASEYLDTIFWLQSSKYGLALRDSLSKIKNDEQASRLLTLLNRNAGPYE